MATVKNALGTARPKVHLVHKDGTKSLCKKFNADKLVKVPTAADEQICGHCLKAVPAVC